MKQTNITLTEQELTTIINALTYKSDRIGDVVKIQELDRLEDYLRNIRTALRLDED